MVSTLSGANFQYDAFGRRTSKTIGGTTTSFLYDGANVAQEAVGGTSTANSLTGTIDEVFQRSDSAGARSFVTDALHSVLALTDSAGAMQTQYGYEPFGNATASGAATTNSFTYTGRELDATGLYSYRARYYSPQLSRFISEDPIGFSGGIKFYAYVGNDPISFVDPLGHDRDPMRRFMKSAEDHIWAWGEAAGGPGQNGLPNVPSGPHGPPNDFLDYLHWGKTGYELGKTVQTGNAMLQDMGGGVNNLIQNGGTGGNDGAQK